MLNILNGRQNWRRNLLFLVIVVAATVAFGSWVIYQIKFNEDLALLQIDLIDTLVAARKCWEQKGEVQDIYQAVQKGKNPSKVLICKNERITKAVYPDLAALSVYHLDYHYLPADRCLKAICRSSGPRLNIGRQGKLLLSCDLAKGFCLTP